jgi:hypothetical protein
VTEVQLRSSRGARELVVVELCPVQGLFESLRGRVIDDDAAAPSAAAAQWQLESVVVVGNPTDEQGGCVQQMQLVTVHLATVEAVRVRLGAAR